MLRKVAKQLLWFFVLSFVLLLLSASVPQNPQSMMLLILANLMGLAGLLGCYLFVVTQSKWGLLTSAGLAALAMLMKVESHPLLAAHLLVWSALVALFSGWLAPHLDFWLAGRAPEWIVAAVIRLASVVAPPGPVRLVNGLLLKVAPGEFTEVDHVVITRADVLVIETKGYTGSIGFDQELGGWTRTKGGITELLRDPVKQNSGHLQAIRNTGIDFPLVSIISLPHAREKGPRVDGVIFGIRAIWHTVRDHASRRTEATGKSDQQIDTCYARLKERDCATPQNRRLHVQRLHELYAKAGDISPRGRHARFRAGLVVGLLLLAMPCVIFAGILYYAPVDPVLHTGRK
jgi:hypothetical protein